jgi:5-deoxy-glucuronate isomerase
MRFHNPAGSLSADGLTVLVEPDGSDWRHTGLLVLELSPGEPYSLDLPGREALVVPLSGALDVVVDGREYAIVGRDNPWNVTDVLYVPLGATAILSVTRPARVAVPFSVAERVFPVQHIGRDAVQSELRGRGICSRQVNNFGTPDVLRADRLIACEVMQPGGNWSSYPPHKHDVAGEGESALEEIYYYEVAASPAGTPGFALQRVYASAAGDIDVTEEVRSGDVVLIPFGYHGPSVAAPGHDLYYLNVMAGPADPGRSDRAWLISDDPAHAWIRESWENEDVDPRLPFGAVAERRTES